MKKILAIALALAMLISLCACGNGAASSANSAASEAPAAASATSAPATPTAAPSQEASTTDVSAAEASAVEPANTVEYPLDQPYTFTFTVIMRNNVLQVLGDDDFSVTSAYKGLTEATGCDVQFTALGEATANEKINVSLASGDMTDFYASLGSYGSNLPGAMQDGILFDFTPYLADCAPNYKALLDSDEDLAAAATNPDGTICSFVSQAADVVDKGILIRQDWLDKLGMEAPTNREDLETVLRAFQSQMGATMPILVNEGLESGLSASFNAAFAGLRSIGFQLTEPDGKEVVATFASQNFIDYILYLNHLYSEGLITDDFMSTGREQGNWESSYYGGKSGVWADGYRELDPANRSNADDPNYTVSPMALTDYDCHVSERSTVSMNGVVYLTTSCQNIEAAMKMMNWCYTDEGKKNGLYGKEGEGYTVGSDGKVALTDNITNNSNGWTVNSALTWYGAQQWLPTCTDMEYFKLVCAKESYDGMEYWTKAYGDKSMKLPTAVKLSPEDTTEYNNLAGDVLTLFSEGAVKVVTGQLDEAGYRDLIENANQMGLTRMTELYQNAYDSYLAAA